MIVEIFNKKVLQKNMVNSENRTDDDIADNEENFEDDVDDNFADNEEDSEDDDVDDDDVEDKEEVRSNDDNYYFGNEDGDVQENVEHVYIEDTDEDNLQASQNRMSTEVAALGEKRKLTLTEEPSRKSVRYRKVNSLFTDYV